jgi:hypothetical protein
MSDDDEVPKLESVDEEYIEIESESGSESEIGSNIEEDELTTVGGELPDIDELENEDFDEYMEDEPYMMDMGGLLSSVLATEEGDTVCSALVNISRQMEVQNKILIKMLSQMQKN